MQTLDLHTLDKAIKLNWIELTTSMNFLATAAESCTDSTSLVSACMSMVTTGWPMPQ